MTTAPRHTGSRLRTGLVLLRLHIFLDYSIFLNPGRVITRRDCIYIYIIHIYICKYIYIYIYIYSVFLLLPLIFALYKLPLGQ